MANIIVRESGKLKLVVEESLVTRICILEHLVSILFLVMSYKVSKIKIFFLYFSIEVE